MREDWSERLLVVIRRYYDPSSEANRRCGQLETKPDNALTRVNRSCGDSVTVYRHGSGETGTISVDVRGCSICNAAAAMAERVAGLLPPEDVTAYCDHIIERINGSAETADFPIPADFPVQLRDDLESLCILAEVPARRRCATLSWEAVREFLAENGAR